VPLLGVVDTAVMGRMPDPSYIGGVALASVVFNFLYWGFGFLRMGTTGLTAQAFGAGDADEARATFGRAFLLALGFGVALIALQTPIAWVGFWLLTGSAEAERQARFYYFARIWDAPATLANFATLGWLLGAGRPRSALAVQLVSVGVNGVLDVWFVLGLGWGTAGVAYATVTAQYAALGVGLAVVAGRGFGGRWAWGRFRDAEGLRRLLRVNGDIFLRTLCLILAFAFFTQQGARMGDVVLAANAILLQFQGLQAYALDAFAHAAEILVGNACGSRDGKAFRSAVRVSTLWAVGAGALYTLVYCFGGTALIAAMTTSDAVRETAAHYLPWATVSPLVSVWSFQLDGIFIGATRTREMRDGMTLSLVVFIALAVWGVSAWGNHGLWAAFLVFMVTRAATLRAFYPRIVHALAGDTR
jgi:MATE family multidrug resistance protein